MPGIRSPVLGLRPASSLTWKMAWEREEVALASVGCCVRFRFPLVSISSSCSAEVGYRGDGQEGAVVSPASTSPQQEGCSSEPMSPPCRGI